MIDPKLVFWDDWLLLSVQAAGLVALVIYVWKTWEMAAATRRAAEASRALAQEAVDARVEALAPRVIVYFDSSPGLGADVVITNAGAGTASQVKLTFSPPLETTSPDKAFLSFFETPQSVIPAGYTIRQMFDAWPSYFKSDLPKQYSVTVEYTGIENKKHYTPTYQLNLEALRERLLNEDPWHPDEVLRLAREVTRNLKAIADTLSHNGASDQLLDAIALRGYGTDRLLLRLWKSMEHVHSDDCFIRNWTDAVRVCRALAVIAVADSEGGATNATHAALVKVLQLLHRRDSDVIGNSQWYEDTNLAFSDLGNLLGSA
jgi:hypothetical protein